MKRFILSLIIGFASATLPASWLCAETVPAKQFTESGVKSITLPNISTDLADGPGRADFQAGCLCCHSARYVITQPKFPRHKWAETVTKMVKVYGAHLDDAQMIRIADYLAAINGAPETLPITNDAPHPEIRWQITPLADTASLEQGAVLFSQNCAGCHGAAGRGDGLVSVVLSPKPANLAAVQFSAGLLNKALWDGVPGTCMPSWRDLNADEANRLSAYVLSLHPSSPAATSSPDLLAHGKVLYSQVCAACHNTNGDAQTAAAKALAPAPTNFQIEQPDVSYVLQVFRDGIPGTAMPSWKTLLSEPDRLALANYVRTLYQPAGQ